jgi:protein SCO1/2
MTHSAQLLAAAALALSILQVSPPLRADVPPPAQRPSVEERLGAQVPLERRFTTSEGAQVQLAHVLGNGKPTLLVLAYNRCTMLCNLVLRGAADVVHQLELKPGRDYNAVTISIDPHELPGEASRTQQMLLVKAGYAGQSQRWPFLVGKEADIRAVAGALGFRYRWDERTQQYSHPAVLFVLSPQGRILAYFYGLRHDAREIEQALRSAAPLSRTQAAASVLSCFRFDTLSQKYGGRIRLGFQLGSAAVLLLLVAGVWRLRRKSRAVS